MRAAPSATVADFCAATASLAARYDVSAASRSVCRCVSTAATAAAPSSATALRAPACAASSSSCRWCSSSSSALCFAASASRCAFGKVAAALVAAAWTASRSSCSCAWRTLSAAVSASSCRSAADVSAVSGALGQLRRSVDRGLEGLHVCVETGGLLVQRRDGRAYLLGQGGALGLVRRVLGRQLQRPARLEGLLGGVEQRGRDLLRGAERRQQVPEEAVDGRPVTVEPEVQVGLGRHAPRADRRLRGGKVAGPRGGRSRRGGIESPPAGRQERTAPRRPTGRPPP